MARPQRPRRSSTLIAYWAEGRLIVHNYLSGARIAVDPILIEFLHNLGATRNANHLYTGAAASRRMTRVLDQLSKHSLVQDGRTHAESLAAWDSWSPLAAAFHFGTKDVRFSRDPEGGERRLARRAKHTPMPPPVKKARRGAAITSLPAIAARGEFVDTLLDRRTWRDFNRRPVELHDVAALLRLTWGVQRRGHAPGQGPIVLKTSPSGGACHPGEVYLLAVRVTGLERGLYHYQAGRHELVLLQRGASARDISRYLPGQPWYRPAAALFLMTAVFGREQWRYPTPRAYRTVLADAGHLCQTFCLAASWLKLAPFCSMALADSVIERDLGIDGVTEGILYAAGVGSRPPGGWRPGVPGLR